MSIETVQWQFQEFDGHVEVVLTGQDKNCETRSLDNIGHYPHYEDPERTVGIIDDFVKAKADLANA
ncbi:alpha/beta fold hydrolase [Rhodococcus opacus]|uniref:alpha/beta fold hydrolase n=1 Tax=Rhodococcus opacus TaxID=37919 RepID=UPI0002E4C9F8|nr:hypothetical protein [Rhodococcus opacus]AHK29060.1 hypothetical protein Pd630_LPD01831 [Rhodococcus opacus PD630]RZK73322.1 MAG: hypothetical protein EOP28_05480 [Rhodococcus sp. (in: high G+C Gram-positive bacteria)]UDG98879.1 hypothetical protein K2Z90_001745 [Rhodococcus opacus PD630]